MIGVNRVREVLCDLRASKIDSAVGTNLERRDGVRLNGIASEESAEDESLPVGSELCCKGTTGGVLKGTSKRDAVSISGEVDVSR
jgi:hypothetical protein